MIKQVLKKVKNIIYSYKYFFAILIIIISLFYIELPYYIKTSGGLINIEDRINNSLYTSEGSFNMTYVTEIKATIPTFLIALINNDWDIVSIKKEIAQNETIEENNYRNKLMLKESNDIATIVAYKLANKNINISDIDFYVTYINQSAQTDLKIGDKIIKINDILIKEYNDIKKIVNNSFNSEITIEVINNKKTYYRKAKIIDYKNTKLIGIIITSDYKIDSDINIKFEQRESGSSGGLIMALAIYNSITSFDLTQGRIIAGTGTIDIDGNVKEIDGISYKLKGAVKEKADIFLTPAANYKEAINLKEKNNYDIEIIKINTINEAIEYLKK